MSAARDLDAALAAYVAYFETLTPATVAEVARHGAPSMRFKDPFNDARGLAAVERAIGSLFTHGTPRTEVLARARDGRVALLRFRFTLARPGAPPLVIPGVSEIRFDDEGRVVEHVDHWDSGEHVYERIALLGWILRRIRARLAAGRPG